MPDTASRIPRHVSRFTFHVSPVVHHTTPHSALRTPHSERGVALVVTLLLLSIITFMAITFLVVSRSQKGSVVTQTDQHIARLAADMALERAKADLLSIILGSTNEFNYGLMVSTNYISVGGFTNGLADPFNVNYDFDSATRGPLSAAERLQNIANLLIMPRPPVYIPTNALGSNDFRFYYDVNRNGRYDTNGFLPLIGTDGLPLSISDYFVGDPEWIGTLERPELLHSGDNQFINRYAYYVVPVGNTLDLNFMHNQAANPAKTSLNTIGAGLSA